MTKKYLRSLFTYDPSTGNLYWAVKKGRILSGTQAGYRSSTARARVVQIDGRSYCVHRLIWQMHHGAIPKGMVIDHIDGDVYNNRLSNLRVVTSAINSRNCKLSKNNKSGYNGVYWRKEKRRWCAELHVDYKKKHIGYFNTPEAAAAAIAAVQSQYGFHKNHGRVVNFPLERS